MIEWKVSWRCFWKIVFEHSIKDEHFAYISAFRYLQDILKRIKNWILFHLESLDFFFFFGYNRQQFYKILIWIFICKIQLAYMQMKSLTLSILRWFFLSFPHAYKQKILRNIFTKITTMKIFFFFWYLRGFKKILFLLLSHLLAKKQKKKKRSQKEGEEERDVNNQKQNRWREKRNLTWSLDGNP